MVSSPSILTFDQPVCILPRPVGGAVPWYLLGPVPLFAHQAKGAASQAASYIDLVTPGTNDLTPGVAPGWTALGGWSGPGADLRTGYVPGDGDVYLVRYAGGVLAAGGWPAGFIRTAGWVNVYGAAPCEPGGIQYYWGNANYFAVPGLVAGVVGIGAAGQGYRAGAPDGVPPGGAWPGAGIELFIMAANLDGGATGQWAGTVQADILWPAASAPTNAQILTVATAMLAL